MSREGCEERLDPAAVGAQPPARGGVSADSRGTLGIF